MMKARAGWIGIGLVIVIMLIVLVGWGIYTWQGSQSPSSEIAAEELQSRLAQLDLLSISELAALTEKIRGMDPKARIPREEIVAPLRELLTHPSGLVRGRAAHALAELANEQAIPYLILALQFELVFSGGADHLAALKELTGQDFGRQWRLWYEWWHDRGTQLPADFEEWIIRLYTSFIPSFGDLLKPDVARIIPLHQVFWGQVIKDEIEALDHPPLVSPSETEAVLLDEEMVFGIAIDGDVRAYPLRYLDVHELLNDTVGGRPVMISFCTLCGSALLYDREVEGTVYSFGNSGLLYLGNKLMFDRETHTLWSNLLGQAVIGPLSEKGLELKRYPLTQTTWGQWRSLYPETMVLVIRPVRARESRFRILGSEQYEPGSAYGEYRKSVDALYPVLQRDPRLPPKSWVFGLLLAGEAKAYPMDLLSGRRVVNDVVGGRAVVLITEPVPVRMDLWQQGATVRVYLRGSHTFRLDDSGVLLDENWSVWERQEEALVHGATGERLARLTGEKSYWFAWSQFHPETKVYRE